MPVLLLELPSQPFRGGLAATSATSATSAAAAAAAAATAAATVGFCVAATVLALGDDALDLLLPPLRRRHLGRVLLSPLCPPVLEPYLKTGNQFVLTN